MRIEPHPTNLAIELIQRSNFGAERFAPDGPPLRLPPAVAEAQQARTTPADTQGRTVDTDAVLLTPLEPRSAPAAADTYAPRGYAAAREAVPEVVVRFDTVEQVVFVNVPRVGSLLDVLA